MQKFTLICDNTFNGSKITYEFDSESLEQIFTEFADFLRGSGFVIDGYIDVVSYDDAPEDYSDHYDDTLDYDHPEANFDWEEDKISLCPVCKLDTNMMKNHSCFDKNCPRSN